MIPLPPETTLTPSRGVPMGPSYIATARIRSTTTVTLSDERVDFHSATPAPPPGASSPAASCGCWPSTPSTPWTTASRSSSGRGTARIPTPSLQVRVRPRFQFLTRSR